MQNFEKPLNEFSEEELQQKVNVWDPRYGALALYELQRRQQKKNTEQISSLIKEIRVLKDATSKNAEISTKNAESDNRLARIAIVISVIAVLTQVAFSIHQKVECRFEGSKEGSNDDWRQDCLRTVDLGVFGTYYFNVADILVFKE